MFLVVFTLTLFLLIIIVLLAQMGLSSKMDLEEANLVALESGFESLKPGLTTSSAFFFLAVLFVLFDLELILLFPGVIVQFDTLHLTSSWFLIISLILLTLSLEWAWFGLKWQF